MGWPFRRRKTSQTQVSMEQLQTPDARSPFDSPAQDAGPGYQTSYGAQSFALPVERVFVITGRGCVVTGTVTSGVISVGRQVRVAAQSGGQSEPYQVSAIEAFREQRESAQAGDNVGLLLSGLIGDQVSPGDRVIA